MQVKFGHKKVPGKYVFYDIEEPLPPTYRIPFLKDIGIIAESFDPLKPMESPRIAVFELGKLLTLATGVTEPFYSFERWEKHDPQSRIALLELAVKRLREGLKEFVLGHTHGADDDHYRKLGNTYGWCDICSTKVNLNEDPARETLIEVEKILKEKDE